MFFNSIKEIKRLRKEICRLLSKRIKRLRKKINRLLSKGMSNINVTIEMFSKLRFLVLKDLSPSQFLGNSD